MSLANRSSVNQINQILKDYHNAEIVTPPNKLKKIYNCQEQTDQTKLNLAMSYSFMVENLFNDKKKGIQLFEIPFSEDNCQAYCGLGYDVKKSKPEDEWWNPDESWVKLSDINDFSCHKGFEKVFQYGARNNHLARQWGDGTILHKAGCTQDGATPVFRVTDANQPFIIKRYGNIKEIWIKPYPQEIPSPYLRWQSTHFGNYVGSAYACVKEMTFTPNFLIKFGDHRSQHYYNKMKKELVNKELANKKAVNKELNQTTTSVASVSKLDGSLFNKHHYQKEKNEMTGRIYKRFR